MNLEARLYEEGSVRFFASPVPPNGAITASTPVFYNPRMVLNRDMTICVGEASSRERSRQLTFLEPLAASGVRGLRFAKEVSSVGKVLIADVRESAYRLMRRNIMLNGLENKVLAVKADANFLMRLLKRLGMRFDFVDIDPFGSPMPFISSAAGVLSKDGLLAATATDLSPLTGSSPTACFVKYGALLAKLEYSIELGLRVLIGSIIRVAMLEEVYLTPVLSFYHHHYYRVFLRQGSISRKSLLANFGYVRHCQICQWRKVSNLILQPIRRCPHCGNESVIEVGPIWTGELASPGLLTRMAGVLNRLKFINHKVVSRKLGMLMKEALAPPLFFDVHLHCSLLRLKPPSTAKVISALIERGFVAIPTHFSGHAVKTNAELKDFQDVLMTCSSTCC